MADCLQIERKRGHAGLGWIKSDAPGDAEFRYRWENAPRGEGFVTIEIEEGEA